MKEGKGKPNRFYGILGLGIFVVLAVFFLFSFGVQNPSDVSTSGSVASPATPAQPAQTFPNERIPATPAIPAMPATKSSGTCQRPVPYHQIYSSLELNLDDINIAYQSDPESFLKATKNEQVYKLMQSSSGVLFALVTKYEYVDSYQTSVPYVYKSSDKGRTWTSVRLPTTAREQTFYTYVSGIAEDSKGNLYAGGRAALWKSTDDGNSWNQIPIPTYDEYYRDLNPYAIRYLMILKDDSLVINVEFVGTAPFNTYKSIDGGNTWTKLFAIPVYSMVEADDGSLVVSDYFGDVYKFSNNVLTKSLSTFWTGTEHPLLKAKDGTIYSVTSENVHYTQSFKYLWGYPIVSYKSKDNGNTWIRMGEVPDALQGGRLLEGADGSIYLGTLSECWGGTIYKLNPNSKKWEVVSGSIPYLSNLGGPLYWVHTMMEIDGKILNAGNLGVIFNSP